MNIQVVKMHSSAPSEPSPALLQALHGAVCMAQDRGYMMQSDNPLLTPPPTNTTAFFRKLPAHFDVTDKLGEEVIRFEFWNVPLNKLPGEVGQLLARRVRRTARHTGVVPARVHLVLLVPHSTRQQERPERQALKSLGAKVEVFLHQFFVRVNHPHHLPSCELLRDQAMLQRFQDRYGSVANLPKISSEDFVSRYLGAVPGDILLSTSAFGGMRSWRLVVPPLRSHDTYTEELEQHVRQQRDATAAFMAYLKTINEDPNHY